MLISAIKRLLPRKSPKPPFTEEKSSAETSEPRAETDMIPKTEYQESEGMTDNTVNESDVTEDLSTVSEEFHEPQGVEDLVNEDLEGLRASFDELKGISSISELPNPTRYAALRDLGLSPGEAYMATRPVAKISTKSHLTSSVPRAAGGFHNAMTKQQLTEARGLFGDMNDTEIQRLYKRVTK